MRKASAVFLAFSLLSAVPAGATTLLALDLDHLAGWADAIVLGRCVSAAPIRGAGTIWTRATFEVLERWKGEGEVTGPRIDVEQLGGAMDGLVADLPGAAIFRPGEESVLFLQRFEDGRFGVLGLYQGKLDLELDASGRPVLFRGGPAPVAGDPAARAWARTAAGGETRRVPGDLRLLGIEGVGGDGRIALDALRAAVDRALR